MKNNASARLKTVQCSLFDDVRLYIYIYVEMLVAWDVANRRCVNCHASAASRGVRNASSEQHKAPYKHLFTIWYKKTNKVQTVNADSLSYWAVKCWNVRAVGLALPILVNSCSHRTKIRLIICVFLIATHKTVTNIGITNIENHLQYKTPIKFKALITKRNISQKALKAWRSILMKYENFLSIK